MHLVFIVSLCSFVVLIDSASQAMMTCRPNPAVKKGCEYDYCPLQGGGPNCLNNPHSKITKPLCIGSQPCIHEALGGVSKPQRSTPVQRPRDPVVVKPQPLPKARPVNNGPSLKDRAFSVLAGNKNAPGRKKAPETPNIWDPRCTPQPEVCQCRTWHNMQCGPYRQLGLNCEPSSHFRDHRRDTDCVSLEEKDEWCCGVDNYVQPYRDPNLYPEIKTVQHNPPQRTYTREEGPPPIVNKHYGEGPFRIGKDGIDPGVYHNDLKPRRIGTYSRPASFNHVFLLATFIIMLTLILVFTLAIKRQTTFISTPLLHDHC